MQRSSFFLRTKLLPPRAVSEFIERPRLTHRLEANVSAPVTVVAADAGCGKTTLIADFVRRQQRPCVWYQLDHTDADPIVFLTYIAHGIKSFAPDFGEALFAYLTEANEDVFRIPERAVDVLINEILESVEQPFILVLDDYHHIGRKTVVHKLVDRLLQYSSDLVHLIITTRDLPPLAIARMRTQSAALVVKREDLLFNDDEVRDLFVKTLGIELKDEEIAEYRGRTHGWITALQLVRQVAEQKIHGGDSGALDLHSILQQTEKDIFDYFAEEVFSRESEETQHLLMYLSLLDSLQLNSCSSLFPDMRCSAALPELAQKNVFLSVAGGEAAGEEYRFHPLFREFLGRRLRSEIGHVKVAEERTRIAEHFLEHGQWEIALPYLLEAQNFDRAAEMIAEVGGEWIAAGAITSLAGFTDRIPEPVLEKHPRSLLYKAETARLQGASENATNLLHRAVKLLNERSDRAGEAEALHALASLARRQARCDEAFELLGKAERLIESDSETYLKCANTRGLCLVMNGAWSDAEQHFRIALEIAESQGNERYVRLVAHNLALGPGFRGDFGEALGWFRRIFRDDQHGKQLPQEAIGHLNVGRLHLYRGEFAESEKHLERALELCQLYNMRFLRGEIFEAYGNFYREREDLAHAEEYYERALHAYDEAEVDVAVKELDEERGLFYLRRGDLPRARTLLENLIAARRQHKNISGVKTAELRLHQVALAEGKADGLPDAVAVLLSYFRAESHHYFEAIAALLLAEAYFALGETKKMTEPLQRALDLTARFDYEFWLRGEIRRNPKLFSGEEIIEKLPLDLREELTRAAKGEVDLKPAAANVQSRPSFPVTDLTINVLGPVEIFRDPAKPFAPDAWTTRRARDIFCYIATARHRRVAKDVLIEAFWHEENHAAVDKNFHPTISHIRKALNSRQPLKQNFLVFRDGAYQLNPELSYSIDTEEFERSIAEAESAKREKDTGRLRTSLEAAYAVYRGEFMAGIYEDWAEERRAYLVEQFARVVAALAKLSFSEKRWSAALKFANEVLRDDPFREDMHRLAMKVLAAQAKPASVKKHFEDLRKLLKTELGIEPAPETRKVYSELLK